MEIRFPVQMPCFVFEVTVFFQIKSDLRRKSSVLRSKDAKETKVQCTEVIAKKSWWVTLMVRDTGY